MLIDGRTIEEIFAAMLEVVKSTHNGYQQLIIVGTCILILLLISKKDRTRMCIPVLLIAILLFIPQLYVYLYEATSYKRFFWLLPDGILVAYVSVLLISKIRITWIKAITATAISLLLIITGQSIYSAEVGCYQKSDNIQQVDASTKELVDNIIALDAEPTCIFPVGTSIMTRVYNENIIQAYGRNAVGFNGPIDPVLVKASSYLDSVNPDTDYVFSVAKSKGIKFVVAYNYTLFDEQIYSEYGYSLCRNVANYNIYYNPSPKSEEKEWYITQYGPDWGKCTLYTIEDNEGNLVIIDGGYEGNSYLIETILREHNFHVSAWIITTLSSAHSGAVYRILTDWGDQIEIDSIFIQNYSEEMLKTVLDHHMDWEESELENVESLVSLIDSFDNVNYVEAGKDYNILGMNMHIYHVWNEEVESLGNRESSNSSMVFSVEGNEDSMLFMSYVTLPIENEIIVAVGENNFDYISVNDHGEWAFDYWWFELMNPSGFFIDNESEKLYSQGNAYPFFTYFSEKGYNTYTFETVPNRITIK